MWTSRVPCKLHAHGSGELQRVARELPGWSEFEAECNSSKRPTVSHSFDSSEQTGSLSLNMSQIVALIKPLDQSLLSNLQLSRFRPFRDGGSNEFNCGCLALKTFGYPSSESTIR